jgi:hypothetical protein
MNMNEWCSLIPIYMWYVGAARQNEKELATLYMCYFYDSVAVRSDTQKIWVNADTFWSGKVNSMSMRGVLLDMHECSLIPICRWVSHLPTLNGACYPINVFLL